jgi:hypothetical protein
MPSAKRARHYSENAGSSKGQEWGIHRMVQRRSMLALDIFFEQPERATQRVRRRLTLVSRHAVNFQFEP